MVTDFKQFWGDRDEFGVGVAFYPDPDGGQAAAIEESASWGALEIWVDGQNLCEHIEADCIVPTVNWYLLPFLEWLAKNWDPLLHEEKLPIMHSEGEDDAWSTFQSHFHPPIGFDEQQADEWYEKWDGWSLRHSLLSCREGGLFPDLWIRRYRDQVEISWGKIRHIGVPPEFGFCCAEGCSRLKPNSVSMPLFELLKASVAYLKPKSHHSVRIEQLLQAVHSIPQTDQIDRLSWMAGLAGDFDRAKARWIEMRERVSEALGEAGKQLLSILPTEDNIVIVGGCDAVLMFGSLSPTLSESDVLEIARNMIAANNRKPGAERLGGLVKPLALDRQLSPPWEQGYELAAECHQNLQLDDFDMYVDVERVLKDLGIYCDEIDLTDGAIRAISLAGPNHQATILLNRNHPGNQFDSGRRFTLAHELCHLLHDRTYGMKLALASGPWAPKDLEKRANAFAAMFIMPTQRVRNLYEQTAPDGKVSIQTVLKITSVLKVSVVGAIDHLYNLGFIDQGTKEQLKEASVKV